MLLQPFARDLTCGKAVVHAHRESNLILILVLVLRPLRQQQFV